MDKQFCEILAELRREKGASQRRAAADLHISQALLSHYENGAREPGLSFVCRACDYYGVTADYLLGRSGDTGSKTAQAAQLRSLAEQLRQLADTAESYSK
jgi:transcriptional regulator with XRE-family HTH domain